MQIKRDGKAFITQMVVKRKLGAAILLLDKVTLQQRVYKRQRMTLYNHTGNNKKIAIINFYAPTW